MSHSFRERLKARELLVGTMVTLGSPEVAEIMASVGFDWLFLDAEHSALGTLDLQRLLQGAGSTPGVVRVASQRRSANQEGVGHRCGGHHRADGEFGGRG